MIRVQVEKGKTKCRTDLPKDIARPISPAVVEKTSEGESLLFDPDFFSFIESRNKYFYCLYQERIKGKEKASPIHTLFHR